jgi:hypothetical protein
MKLKQFCTLVAILLAAQTVPFAQSKSDSVLNRVEDVLRKNREKKNFDTLYMARLDYKLTLKLRGNLSGNSIHARYDDEGGKIKTKLNTSTRATVSVGVNYMGLAAGLAINPANLSGKNKDMEFNLSAYFNRFGLEGYYQQSKTLSGTMSQGDASYHLDKGVLRLASVYLTGYYAFNHKRFSYPAAFTHSYIQKRSAGSWLAGVSFQGGTIKNSESAPATLPQMRIEADNLGIGAGYGYNFVLGQKWLIHLSALPTVVVFNHNNLTINGVRKSAKAMRFNMIFNERLALVHNFSDRYFAGATAVMNNTLFDDEVVVINQNKWRFRAFFGVRIP